MSSKSTIENNKSKKKSFSFYISILLGFTSIFFAIQNHSNEEDLKISQAELNAARDSLTIYIHKTSKFKSQYMILKELNKEKETK